jgi:hypothetical protein
LWVFTIIGVFYLIYLLARESRWHLKYLSD